MSFEQRFLSIAGNRTQLLCGGVGPPLLYLHSSGSETRCIPFHEALARHFTVFAPAHPGFDGSEGLEQIESIEDLVSHYVRFLDALQLDQINLVGISLGGWIAAELAVRCSHRLRRLVLIDAAGLRVPDAPIGPLWDHLDAPERLRPYLFGNPGSALARFLLPPRAEMSEALVELHHKANRATARVGWNPYLHHPTLRRRLAHIAVKTLVVWGEKDRLIPLAHGVAYSEGIPGARLLVLPGCGHLPIYEKTSLLANSIVDFLKSE